jgi:two-component system cell cycle sensor histidine kinase/response regulator CckA
LTVSDTGTGMDQATIDQIFEPFFTTKEIGKGTGLGLATALGVVNQHGGSIEVLSELGKGTSFHVYLPVSERSAEPEAQKMETAVVGGRETILVADDHEGVRDTTREILEKLGYRVILARDGEEAFKEFTAHNTEIALLLLDVVMPRLPGPDVYAKISDSKPGIPVIFTTGYSEEATWMVPTLGCGAIFLQKPYGPKVLARKIRELLDQKPQVNSLN